MRPQGCMALARVCMCAAAEGRWRECHDGHHLRPGACTLSSTTALVVVVVWCVGLGLESSLRAWPWPSHGAPAACLCRYVASHDAENGAHVIQMEEDMALR